MIVYEFPINAKVRLELEGGQIVELLSFGKDRLGVSAFREERVVARRHVNAEVKVFGNITRMSKTEARLFDSTDAIDSVTGLPFSSLPQAGSR
jgi:hypothetical protein